MEEFDLRAFREKLGISQGELARRVSYSQPHISAMEQGRRPVTKRFVALLKHVFKARFWEAIKQEEE